MKKELYFHLVRQSATSHKVLKYGEKITEVTCDSTSVSLGNSEGGFGGMGGGPGSGSFGGGRHSKDDSENGEEKSFGPPGKSGDSVWRRALTATLSSGTSAM